MIDLTFFSHNLNVEVETLNGEQKDNMYKIKLECLKNDGDVVIYLSKEDLEELHYQIENIAFDADREDLEAEIEDLKEHISELESRLEETAQLVSSRDREIKEREHRKEVF